MSPLISATVKPEASVAVTRARVAGGIGLVLVLVDVVIAGLAPFDPHAPGLLGGGGVARDARLPFDPHAPGLLSPPGGPSHVAHKARCRVDLRHGLQHVLSPSPSSPAASLVGRRPSPGKNARSDAQLPGAVPRLTTSADGRTIDGMIFHDATISMVGNRQSTRTHDSADLAPAAVEVFRSMFEQHGDHFRVPLPVAGLEWLELAFDSEAEGAALATFWRGDVPITTSALAGGVAATADREVLRGVQSLILQLTRPHGTEAAFDVLAVDLRPLIVSVPIAPDREELLIVADAETCLAAAWFGHWGTA